MKRVCLSATATLAITVLIACAGNSTNNPVGPSVPAPPATTPASALVIIFRSPI